MARFLPTSTKEGMSYYRDFSGFDVVFVSGDPSYDHPLSGIAILARLLDAKGYRVGIIPQPENKGDYQACGKPKLLFCITSGLLDSMLANYSPMLKKREGVVVPERAVIRYTQRVKEAYPGCITVIGGVEATIRRFTHFDYRENKLRHGILNDSKADLLLFGNAERSLLTLLDRLKRCGGAFPQFTSVRDTLDLPLLDGAAFRAKKAEFGDAKTLPSYEECVEDKDRFNLLTKSTTLFPDEAFIEPSGAGFVRHNRPSHPLTDEEMDFIYTLPFTRRLHPRTKNLSQTEAMVAKLHTSVIIGRGCWGSCSFCIIPLVQGKKTAKRSIRGILTEVEGLMREGHDINDLTMATVNMYGSRCALYNKPASIFSPIIGKDITVFDKAVACGQRCVGCPNRVLSDDLIQLLKGVERLRRKYGRDLEIRSAIRHDIILSQKELFRMIMRFTKRLKIAPEHISDTVLQQMNKSDRNAFERFLQEFDAVNREQGTRKLLVPYLVAAHPGCSMEEMRELKRFCDQHGIHVNLTQVFTPTPGTVSTATYFTGKNPLTNKETYVPRTFREKKDQKNILLSDEVRDENG
ncbi:MAG: hypothetical protein V1735_04105 [Nanoarchaeota archaeon]